MWKPEIISMFLSASVSVLTLFTFFQSRMTNSERRTTILEEKDKQHDKELIEIKKRLDNHDKQNEALIMINWKLRFKNKATLLAIASTVILLAQQLGLKLPDNIADVVNTFLTLLVLLGVVNDPTTAGVSDSGQAMDYAEPRK